MHSDHAHGVHAPGDLLEAFLIGVALFADFPPDAAPPRVEYRGAWRELADVSALLFDCADALPADAFDALQACGYEGPHTYGDAARWLHAECRAR